MNNKQTPDSVPFFDYCKNAFEALFSDAKNTNEIEYAHSLISEFRPYDIKTFDANVFAISQYKQYFEIHGIRSQFNAGIALACYSHISESSGLWEIVSNMLSVKNGFSYNIYPFAELVKKFGDKTNAVTPNANKVLRSIITYSRENNAIDLVNIFQQGFDADVRNGFAHADYVIQPEGIYLGLRYKNERFVTWEEFGVIFNRGMTVYDALTETHFESLQSYKTPRIIIKPEPDKNGADHIRIELIDGNFSISQMFIPNGQSQ